MGVPCLTADAVCRPGGNGRQEIPPPEQILVNFKYNKIRGMDVPIFILNHI
jgi:hypothetical protein